MFVGRVRGNGGGCVIVRRGGDGNYKFINGVDISNQNRFFGKIEWINMNGWERRDLQQSYVSKLAIDKSIMEALNKKS